MQKAKTLKAFSKRLRITKRGKIMRRLSQQGHFKAKEPGEMRRKKRKPISAQYNPLIRKALTNILR